MGTVWQLLVNCFKTHGRAHHVLVCTKIVLVQYSSYWFKLVIIIPGKSGVFVIPSFDVPVCPSSGSWRTAIWNKMDNLKIQLKFEKS